MKIPEPENLAEVVRRRLDPCINEHTAHVDEAKQPRLAWLTCGADELTTIAVTPETDLPAFFQREMLQHLVDGWHAIAEALLQ